MFTGLQVVHNTSDHLPSSGFVAVSYSSVVLDYDGVATAMADGTYKMIVH